MQVCALIVWAPFARKSLRAVHSDDVASNVAKATKLVRDAAAAGAQIILLQELFESTYFCQDQLPALFDLAKPFEGNPLIAHFSELAKELRVVRVS